MTYVDTYATQNWTITPITEPRQLPRGPQLTPSVPIPPPIHLPDVEITPGGAAADVPYPSNQRWQLTLTGVVICDVKGTSESVWHYETVEFKPDVRPALEFAARTMGATTDTYAVHFDTDLWAPHVTPATTFNDKVAHSSGHGVDAWRPSPFWTDTDVFGVERRNIFTGVQGDVVVRDTDAIVYRLAYHVTLVGRLTLHYVQF